MSDFRIKVSLITGVPKRLYPLVPSRSDFKTVYCEGYNGTGNSNILYSAQIDLQTHVLCGWKLISDQCTVRDITELE